MRLRSRHLVCFIVTLACHPALGEAPTADVLPKSLLIVPWRVPRTAPALAPPWQGKGLVIEVLPLDDPAWLERRTVYHRLLMPRRSGRHVTQPPQDHTEEP